MHDPIPDLARRILYDRDGLLVVDKPYDIPTSGRTLDDPDCVQYGLMQREGAMIWVVHQLDADTTGLNLFVREKSLVAVYKDRLSRPETSKTYLALVHGCPGWQRTEIRAPIGKVDARSLGVHPDGKSAHTELEVVVRGAEHAWVTARIFTGRTHQIRIHLAHLGHALVGEEWYAARSPRAHVRQALHALTISLAGPTPLELHAPLAPDLVALGERLGLARPPNT